MRTRRIEYYFPVVSQKRRPSHRRLTFFDFPYSVRKRIYDYTELADGKLLDLNFRNLSFSHGLYAEPDTAFCAQPSCTHFDVSTFQEHWQLDPEESGTLFFEQCNCYDTHYPCGLLFVTKQVSQEIQQLLFSRNRFQIDQASPHGLRWLERLGSYSLSSLTCLNIRLDTEGTCEPRTRWRTNWWSDPLPQPMSLGLQSQCPSVRDWSRCLDHLARSIPPKQLKLYLKFRAINTETAEAVLQPLLRLPQLQHCGIAIDRE